MTAAALVLLATTASLPTLDQVLARAGAYVMSFARELAGIVGEEHYVQEATAERTELRSDLLLVRVGGALGYEQYRDVFEVDGRPVRDRAERISALLNAPAGSADDLRRRIIDENARFNIGDIMRTMNVPLLVLEFLAPKNQYRFKFKRVTDRVPRTFTRESTPTAAFRVSTEVWVVEYQEREPATMIRTAEGRDLPSRGRVWVEPDTGRVLMTELLSENRELRATVDVSFQSEPLLGLLVPVEMRERYDGRRNGSRIDATATYSNFRRVETTSRK